MTKAKAAIEETVIAYKGFVGENGIKAGAWYTLDDAGEFQEVV